MAAAMKLALLFLAFAVADGIRLATQTNKAASIADVVKILQGMLDKSKSDNDGERELYAKYKCYCDDNEDEKTTSVEDLTKEIALLESEIDGLQGDTGSLSTAVASLKAKMDQNEEDQEKAKEMRKKENEEFEDTEEDLENAIGQMKDAIKTLSAIGADQTLAESQDNKQFMAGFDSLVSVKQSIGKAMKAAEAFLPNDERVKALSLIQKAPFTGTYSAQSGEVVGILKSMKDTFEANLDTARDVEKKQKKAFDDFMEVQEEAYEKLETSYNKKQGIMSDNDGSLSGKVAALETAKAQKEEDEEFLVELKEMCNDKMKDYEKRKMFRAREEQAIAQAVSILNSDRSADAFSKVDSGKGASFVQLGMANSESEVRTEVKLLLQHAAFKDKSTRLAKVASLLAVGQNPFTEVLLEIKKMKKLIGREAKQDKEHLDWCTEERKVNDKRIEDKSEDLTNLESAIDQVVEDIEHPETGFIAMIKQKEQDLKDNREAQETDTTARREENAQYQESIANIVKAESLLEKAIETLTEYYADLKAKQIGLLQKDKKQDPPSTWEGPFKGQEAKGNEVVNMLQSILDGNHAEQTTVHDNEVEAQHDYEDNMKALTDEEAQLTKDLKELEKGYADAKLDREEKHAEHDQTFQDRRAIIRYLESIKPPCDFITDNYDMRETNRETELSALNLAAKKIKGTPAFAKAQAADLKRKRGPCAETCEANDAHVDCKACMADTSVPGYCAGHPGTAGC